MNIRYSLLILLLVLSADLANAQIRLIVLDQYNLKKGDSLSASLSSHIHMMSESAPHDTETISTNVNLIQKSKRINLNSFISPDQKLLKFKPVLSGPAFLETTQKSFGEYSREEYLDNFKEQGLTSVVKGLESILNKKDNVKDSAVFYTKSMITVDKNKPFSKQPIGNGHEITLKDNPFGATYGDQLSAQLTFRGRPLPNAPVVLFVKANTGNIISEVLITDEKGMVRFKLDMEGVYFLQHLIIAEVSTNNEVNTLWSTFSFQFINTDYKRSSYTEFGF